MTFARGGCGLLEESWQGIAEPELGVVPWPHWAEEEMKGFGQARKTLAEERASFSVIARWGPNGEEDKSLWAC